MINDSKIIDIVSEDTDSKDIVSEGENDESPTKYKFEKDITDEIKRKIKERFSSKGSSDNRENEEEDKSKPSIAAKRRGGIINGSIEK